jgi:hypothetical protein
MALTHEVRVKLEGRGFKTFYDKHREVWENLAEQVRTLVAGQIHGHLPGVDDLRDILIPLIALNPLLRDFLHNADRPMTESNWIPEFADYVLDRVYQPGIRPLRRQPHGNN